VIGCSTVFCSVRGGVGHASRCAIELMTEMRDQSDSRRSTRFGVVGLVVAFFALVAAVLSPWIVEALEPEAKPIDEVAVDAAVRIKDRLAAKIKGEEFVEPPPEKLPFDWAKWLPAGTISLGLFGMCCGTIGFVRREDIRINASAVTIGLAAIVFQYFLLIAAALILILLIAIVLSALGISP